MKFCSARRFLTFVILTLYFIIVHCTNDNADRDFRQDMRIFVQDIGNYARTITPGFLIIAQNGQELFTENGESSGQIVQDYINTLDGAGREDLYYGYITDDIPTPESERNYMLGFLDIAETNDIEVMIIDYCTTHVYVDSSYMMSAARGYLAFAANHRQLDDIPVYPAEPYNMNTDDILDLSTAHNFLYLINTQLFTSKTDFLNAIQNTDYDILIIDLFYEGSEMLDVQEIASLKQKASGGARMVFAYCSIGEAENYRYYWQTDWATNPPDWLAQENPNWPGNYRVRYWEQEWQNIIFGNDNSYVKKILDAGFHGIYLDIIDAFEYFENE